MVAGRAQVAIFGAGVAGLWIHHRLRAAGFDAVLFAQGGVGGHQTLASQGMIHGGQKYDGASGHAESIAAMPAIWAAAFADQGTPRLGQVQCLSRTQLFLATDIVARGVAWMAQSAVRAQARRVTQPDWPTFLQDAPAFTGTVYEVDEPVVDTKTLVRALMDECEDSIYRVDAMDVAAGAGGLAPARVLADARITTVEADHYVFTAATGNEAVAAAIAPGKRLTQRRPLKQLMIRPLPHPLYAHCLAMSRQPRVTITAHPMPEGGYVWYLGGEVAQYGVGRPDGEAIANGQREMAQLFPWIDWRAKQWSALSIDRAEPWQAAAGLPLSPHVEALGNALLAWPTKMTFAPALSQRVESHLAERGLRPRPGTTTFDLPRPAVGQYPWETASWQ